MGGLFAIFLIYVGAFFEFAPPTKISAGAHDSSLYQFKKTFLRHIMGIGSFNISWSVTFR